MPNLITTLNSKGNICAKSKNTFLSKLIRGLTLALKDRWLKVNHTQALLYRGYQEVQEQYGQKQLKSYTHKKEELLRQWGTECDDCITLLRIRPGEKKKGVIWVW